MTTLQIASAKEQFLANALRLITPLVNNGDGVVSLPEDVESLARDTIDLFATLLRCDEQHNLRAATAEDYPYLATGDTRSKANVLWKRYASTPAAWSTTTRRSMNLRLTAPWPSAPRPNTKADR